MMCTITIVRMALFYHVLPIHYLHPKKLIEYLVRCHPVVVFGTPDACKARESLLAFWEGYQQYHPTHAAFSLGVPMEQLIPVVLHGDEGRGKRRSNTTVFSWESPIGIKGHSSVCTACAPTGSWSPQCAQGHPFKSLLRSNMKSHSCLQHWPMFLLPGTLWKTYKMLTLELITFLSGQFETLVPRWLCCQWKSLSGGGCGVERRLEVGE